MKQSAVYFDIKINDILSFVNWEATERNSLQLTKSENLKVINIKIFTIKNVRFLFNGLDIPKYKYIFNEIHFRGAISVSEVKFQFRRCNFTFSFQGSYI